MVQTHGKAMAVTGVLPALEKHGWDQSLSKETKYSAQTRNGGKQQRKQEGAGHVQLFPCTLWSLAPAAPLLVPRACSFCCTQDPATLSSAQQRPRERQGQAPEPPVLLHTRLPQLHQLPEQALQPHSSAARLV